MKVIMIIAAVVHALLVQWVASTALPSVPDEVEAGANNTDVDLTDKKKHVPKHGVWWQEPECNSFGNPPSDEPGWNYQREALGYCECRRIGAYYWCQLAIPNDDVIDPRQIKEAVGDHWECGQSVIKSIGMLHGGFPTRKNFVLSHDQTCFVRFRQMLNGEVHGKEKRLEKINRAYHSGTCNAFRAVECIDLGDVEEEDQNDCN